MNTPQIKQFSQKLLTWFDKHGRKELPWQQNTTPYRVWVSEIMLQQTQVSTVIPYYQRFMKRFATIDALAQAHPDEVLELWTGLGYYARARNLYSAAQIIKTKHKGKFPLDFDSVLALPGIGRSTAGAILAISAQQRFPILDGNVKRVLCRYFAIEGFPNDKAIETSLWQLSEQLTPTKRVPDYTQAIMDLGATLCTRTRPHCERCPLKQDCKAKQLENVLAYPIKQKKPVKPVKAKNLILLIHPKQRAVLLEKRPAKGIWGGLWSLPECPPKTKVEKWCLKTFNLNLHTAELWPSFRHTFTHFHLDIQPVLCKIKSNNKNLAMDAPYQWHTLEKIGSLGMAAPVKRLLEQV